MAGGDAMLPFALSIGERIAELKCRAAEHGVATIYVNDNFGRWRSDFRAQVAHCLDGKTRGHALVERLRPSEDDYFVLKPMHSGFFGTTLEILSRHLGTQTLVLTGIPANNCVLFTANDAHMRGYELVIRADAVAANSCAEVDTALAHLRTVVKASTPPSSRVDFARLLKAAGP